MDSTISLARRISRDEIVISLPEKIVARKVGGHSVTLNNGPDCVTFHRLAPDDTMVDYYLNGVKQVQVPISMFHTAMHNFAVINSLFA